MILLAYQVITLLDLFVVSECSHLELHPSRLFPASCCLDSFGRAAEPPAFRYQDLPQRLIITVTTLTGLTNAVSGVVEMVLDTYYLQGVAIAYHRDCLGANDLLRSPGKMLQLWQ